MKFLILALFLSTSVMAQSPCETSKWQFSKLDIEVSDADYLKMVMGFSYGPEVTQFIPYLKQARSNMYYVESMAKPLITFFSADYKDEKNANAAYSHLEKKWMKNTKNQYEVMKKGLKVTWFGNNRLEPKCFYDVVAQEKKKL